MKRIECKGVGDNNGFYEMDINYMTKSEQEIIETFDELNVPPHLYDGDEIKEIIRRTISTLRQSVIDKALAGMPVVNDYIGICKSYVDEYRAEVIANLEALRK